MVEKSPMRKCILVLSALCVSVSAGCGSSPIDSEKTSLETKIRTIFTENCHRCHGIGGSPDGDFYVLDHESLLAHSVVPGKPEESLLFMKVRSGEMPPIGNGNPLSPGDQEIVRQWIVAGAPDFGSPSVPRKFISPEQILETLQADLKQLRDADRPFARYFSTTHLYNADLISDRMESYRVALSKLVNSLSWGPKIVPPRPIDPSNTLFRIDLRDYQWNAGVWETIANANPYGVSYGTPAEKYCTTVTGSAQPLVRGDWFVFAASRPPLYHDVLQLPANDLELEKLLQVNVSENIRTGAVARAGVAESQTVGHNRLLERHESPLTRGAYWKTYDFASNEDLKSLMTHPLGPRGQAANAFEHDSGEIAFQLPNGLLAYVVLDSRGNRMDSPLLGARHDRHGRRDVNGISCMACHTGGVIQAVDAVRQYAESSLSTLTRTEVDLVRTLYPTREKLASLMTQDAKRFADALIQTGCRLSFTDPIAKLVNRYEDELSPKQTAAELGLPVDEFLVRFEKSPELSRDLDLQQAAGQTIARELFLKSFGAIVSGFSLGKPLLPSASLDAERISTE